MMVGVLFALPLLTSCTASPSDLSATVATDPITVRCRTGSLTTSASATQIADPNASITKVRFTFDLRNENGTTLGSAGTKVVDVFTSRIVNGKPQFETNFSRWTWSVQVQYFVGTTAVRSVNENCVIAGGIGGG